MSSINKKISKASSGFGYFLVAVLAVFFIFHISKSLAAPTIDISAYIVDQNDQEISNQNLDVTFTLYNTPEGSSGQVWQEMQSVPIVNGIMKAQLGSQTPFPTDLDFSANQYYLGMKIGNNSESTPRKKIAISPFSVTAISALKAKQADSAIDAQSINGATVGTASGNIPTLGNGGKLNANAIPTVTQLGTVSTGVWQGTQIANNYIAKALTGKTYNGLTFTAGNGFSISGGGAQLSVSGSNIVLDQDLSTTATPNFAGLCIAGVCKSSWLNVGNTSPEYTAGGSLLQLNSTQFSIKEGTLTDGKLCTYSSASGLVCNTDLAVGGAESDPVFSASAASGITNTNITNWNSAYSWGNHATAGYLTASSTAALTNKSGNISMWTNDAHYITLSSLSSIATGLDYNNTTGVFSLTSGYAIPQNSDITNWNSKQAGSANLASLANLSYTSGAFVKMTGANTFTLDTNSYLTSYAETDPRLPASGTSGNLLRSNGTVWTSWTPNFLTSFTETDPIFGASVAKNIVSSDVTNWNTAYSQSHSAVTLTGQGYLSINGSQQITVGQINLASSNVSGILSLANGGTGIGTTNPGNGTLLIGNGTGYALSALTAGTGIGISNASGSITITNTNPSNTYSASGTLLNLTGTTFSVNSGTLNNGNICTYAVGTGIVCNTTVGGVGTNFWQRIGTYLSPADSGDSVGIGTTNPGSFKLAVAGNIGPSDDNVYSLGTASNRFKDLHLGPSSVHMYNSYVDAGNYEQGFFGFEGTSTVDSSLAFNPIQESQFTQEDFAYAATITPSAASGQITLTLGSGNWNDNSSVKKGMRIAGNGGVATILADPTAQNTILAMVDTSFANTNAISSGSWHLYGTMFSSGLVNLNTDGVYGNDASAKLLLHNDGINGSTTFTDSSASAHAMTNFGSPSVSTAQSEFGGASGYFNGSSYLRTPYTSDFNLSSGDWTIDAWINSSSFASPQVVVSKDRYGVNWDWAIQILNSTTLRLQTNGANTGFSVTVPAMSTGQWYHIAYVHYNGNNTIYLNGVAYGSYAMSITDANHDYVTVGCSQWNNPNSFFNGYIDELRISAGVARWTSNFTPPAKYYSNGVPVSSYFTTVTNTTQLNTSDWSGISQISPTETLNGQEIDYAISFDGRTTFEKYDTASGDTGWRPIARNNGGTWQYNSNASTGASNVTWTNSSVNNQNSAISQAMSVSANHMSGTNLSAVNQAQWESGFAAGTLDISETMKSTNVAQTPTLDQITIKYLGGPSTGIMTLGTKSLGSGTLRDLQLKTGSNVALYATSTGNIGIGTATPAGFFDVNGKLTVLSNGNVGIGTTAPGYALDVNGIINATALYVNGVNFTGGQWITNGSNIGYTSGNVGVGTTNPLDKLHVFGGNLVVEENYGLSVNDSQAGVMNLIKYSASNDQLQIGNSLANGLTGGITFDTAGESATAMTILNGGNVGIGTTNPGASLDVSGTAYLQKLLTTGNNVYNSADPKAADIIIGSDAGTRHNSSMMFWSAASASRIYYNDTQSFYLSPWNSDAVTGANIALSANGSSSYIKAGNFGIGTTNPLAALDMGSGGIRLGGVTLTSWPSGTSQWITSGSNIYYSSGNVGIGTTNPGAKLEIIGVDNAANFRMLKGDMAAGAYSAMWLGKAAATGQLVSLAFKYIDDSNSYAALGLYGDDVLGGAGLLVKKGGYVGIGTTNPHTALEIASANVGGYGNLTIRNTGASGGPGMVFYNDLQTGIRAWMDVDTIANTMTIQNYNNASYGALVLNPYGGNIGIGTTKPNYLLSLEASGGGYYSSSDHSWHNGSSIRWKENVTPINNALTKIDEIQGVYYDWKEEYGGAHSMGFIAEDLGKVLPELVDWDPNDPGYANGINYGNLTALLAQGIKEQQTQITGMNNQITNLQSTETQNVASLQSQLDDQNLSTNDKINLVGASVSAIDTATKNIASLQKADEVTIADHETRIKSLEDQMADIEQEYNSIISFLSVTDGTYNLMDGKLEAAGVTADGFTVRVKDNAVPMFGEATVKAGDSYVTVINSNVKDSSFINLTLKSNPGNLAPFVSNQQAGSFDISFSSKAANDVKVNWWILQSEGQGQTDSSSGTSDTPTNTP